MKFKYGVLYLLLSISLSACFTGEVVKTSYYDDVAIKKKKFLIPFGYEREKVENRSFESGISRINLYANSFKQGDIVYCEILFNDSTIDRITNVSLFFEKKNIPVVQKKWGFRTFFAISPKENLGKKELVLKYEHKGQQNAKKIYIGIEKANFKVYKKALFFGKLSDVNYEKNPKILLFIKESRKHKRKAFSVNSRDKIDKNFSHPRDLHFVTSPFWSKRVYSRYKTNKKGKRVRLKDRVKIHRGLDLRGKAGTPVYSLARGRVVMSRKTYYEGNMVIIDHGNKIFSYFMHLKKRLVKEGDIVYGGDRIATVGSTGRSTAAHLHVSLMVRGVQVHPLSLLSLPVRD